MEHKHYPEIIEDEDGEITAQMNSRSDPIIVSYEEAVEIVKDWERANHRDQLQFNLNTKQ